MQIRLCSPEPRQAAASACGKFQSGGVISPGSVVRGPSRGTRRHAAGPEGEQGNRDERRVRAEQRKHRTAAERAPAEAGVGSPQRRRALQPGCCLPTRRSTLRAPRRPIGGPGNKAVSTDRPARETYRLRLAIAGNTSLLLWARGESRCREAARRSSLLTGEGKARRKASRRRGSADAG